MTLLHIIDPSGQVVSQEWTGELHLGAPSYDEIRKFLGGHRPDVEHVTVLWKGKRAHMFVDENGRAQELPVNLKATRVYFNATADRCLQQLIYGDLEKPPQFTKEELTPDAVQVLTGFPPIVGVAVLWEGDLE